MSDRSQIEWTDATWNPVRGCTKISPGCKYCYAETFAERFRGVPGHPYEQGFDLKLVPHKLLEPLTWSRPRMVFVNSMSDLFQQDVPEEYVQLTFEVMLAANWHIYQVLTKRGDRMAELTRRLPLNLSQQSHIWLGVSVEDRKYGVPRIEQLRRADAAVRFLSVEPLLEEISPLDLAGIDWVIVGGESGRRPRPMKAEWVRTIRDQCVAEHVSFFFKQWGGRNKKKTGRMLDDRKWDEFPIPKRSLPPGRKQRHEILRRLEQRAAPILRSISEAELPRTMTESRRDRAVTHRPEGEVRGGISTQQHESVLRMLAQGCPKEEIAATCNLSVRQVAAVAGHVTMGTHQLPREPQQLKRRVARSSSED